MGAVTLVPATANAAFPGSNGPIVFTSSGSSSGHSCSARYHQDQLFSLSMGGSGPVQLTCTTGRVRHPFVSPDGSEVVFSSTRFGGTSQLFTLPLHPTGSRHRTNPTLASGMPNASDDYPSWSPADDGTIVFQRTAPGSIAQLFFENVSDPSTAAPVFPSPTGFTDTEPVFDPSDPQIVAFVRKVGDHTHIFSYNLGTQMLTDLSQQGNGGGSGNDSKPDFAPTGTAGRIVFQSDRSCGRAQLYTMTTLGTDQEPVFRTSSHRSSTGSPPCSDESDDPVYSPQGDALAFDRASWGSWERLYTVSIDPSGAAVGNATRIKADWVVGDEPNWGAVGAPPAQTPETSLPVILPVVGAAVAGVVLVVRRRRTRRELLPTSTPLR